MTKQYCSKANQKPGTFALPALPFNAKDLAPYISEQTLSFHHGKHHNTYVINLNKLLETQQNYQSMSLEEIIVASKDVNAAIFNNAAQIWNHSFFWHCIKTNGGGKPAGKIAKAIDEAFGSYENFVEKFSDAAKTQFGSGWAWLIKNTSGKLEIIKTSNADVPLTQGTKPLLTIDVWEHAYYLDYQNLRPTFISNFVEHLINWDFVNEQFEN